MEVVLKAKPISVQAKFKLLFVPPKYDLFKVDSSAALATRLAHSYGLKSTEIIVNQNAAASQYISLRYFLKGEPFRYIDVVIGLDQMEVVFSNPASVLELRNEMGKAICLVLDQLKPVAKDPYFEATLHCESEKPSAKAFLNEVVRLPADGTDARKGFSFSTQVGEDWTKLNLEVSDHVADGLYAVFVFVRKAVISDPEAFPDLFGVILDQYRKMQEAASVQILERE